MNSGLINVLKIPNTSSADRIIKIQKNRLICKRSTPPMANHSRNAFSGVKD